MSLSLDRTDLRSPEDARPQRSVWLFRAVVLLLFGILTAQLWRLQVIDGRAYANRSIQNSVRTAPIPPQRGVIYDRNKSLLATNAPIFVVTITPADVPSGKLQEVIIRLSNELHVAPMTIQRALDARKARNDYSPFSPIPVAFQVDRDSVMRISEHTFEMQGVQVSVESTRRYNDGALTSHLLGYMGPIPADEADQFVEQGYSLDDRVGSAGVEQWYEKDLRGVPGKRAYQVEVTGQEVGELRRDPARSGNNLLMTIDMDLQRDVAKILQEGLRNTPSGAAIVMDPRNGEILAMVSSPTFDNNIIGDPSRDAELQALFNDTTNLPMFPRAYGAQYAPGSVFKLVTGSAALQEAVATRDTVIESKGFMEVENDQYPDVKDRLPDTSAYGKQTFIQGLSNSSNIYFWWLGGGYQEGGRTIFSGLGVDRLARYARDYGYGSPTGLDVPGEKDGLIPDDKWKQLRKNQPWFKGDTYNMSIGQGDVLATPLQVALTTSTIANGGTVYEPHLVKAELDSNGNAVKLIQPATRQVGVSGSNLATMREAMEWSWNKGPWLKWFAIPGLRVAGKTGTAEFEGPLDPKTRSLPTHGWFTGFAHADNPEISVTVFVDRGSGTNDASPIAARIIRRYFHMPDVPPDAPKLPPVPQPAPLPPPAGSYVPGP